MVRRVLCWRWKFQGSHLRCEFSVENAFSHRTWDEIMYLILYFMQVKCYRYPAGRAVGVAGAAKPSSRRRQDNHSCRASQFIDFSGGSQPMPRPSRRTFLHRHSRKSIAAPVAM
jgi:hypothetical protein